MLKPRATRLDITLEQYKIALGKKLGQGAYASVYNSKTSKDRVIRVSRVSRQDIDCDGWLQYYNTLKYGKVKSVHAPKIYSIRFFRDSNDVMFFVAELEKLRSLTFNARAPFDTIWDPTLYRNVKRIAKKISPSFVEFVQNIHKHKSHKNQWDLHCGNVMMRADNTLVITDPFC